MGLDPIAIHSNFFLIHDYQKVRLALHPASTGTTDEVGPTSFSDDTANNSDSEDVTASTKLDAANKLLGPDPGKANSWVPQPATSWIFQPGELCPAPRVRMTRGAAWLEMSFDALTGNVENETAYFP